jgi:hypothetical protein
MPFGLQLVGRLRGDAALLAAAQALERSFAADPALCRPRPALGVLADDNPSLRSIVTHAPGAPDAPAGGTGSRGLTAV